MRLYNYFELERGKKYLCNLDDANFKGNFEYKLHKHYLVYRKRNMVWDYDRGVYKQDKWKGVWNPKWYTDTLASYKEIS